MPWELKSLDTCLPWKHELTSKSVCVFKQQLQHALSLWNASISTSLPLSLSPYLYPALCLSGSHNQLNFPLAGHQFPAALYCNSKPLTQVNWLRFTTTTQRVQPEHNFQMPKQDRKSRRVGERGAGEVENSLSAKFYALSNYPRVL